MQCSGKADDYNSHSNIKAAIKLNYNSKVKKKVIVNTVKSIKLWCDKGETGNPEPSTTTLSVPTKGTQPGQTRYGTSAPGIYNCNITSFVEFFFKHAGGQEAFCTSQFFTTPHIFCIFILKCHHLFPSWKNFFTLLWQCKRIVKVKFAIP